MRKELENEKKNKSNNQGQTSETDNNSEFKTRNEKMKDKTKDIMDRYPVKIFKDVDNEILQFVASEDAFIIKFQYDICRKVEKNIKDITYNDIFDFKVKHGELKNTNREKTRFKNKLRRCRYLYNIYKEKLSNFKISLYYLSAMSEEDWKIWINEFHKLIMDIYPDFEIEENEENICKYVFKSGNRKGELCGKYECENKFHK